jgi:hypothetical protein
MALKYYFEFTDVETIKHKVEIYNDDFVGDATLVYGTCSLTKASTKDTLEPIRGGGLKIDLEASTDLDFTDLYSEEERTFSVKYYRNENLHSLYWIDPEGLFQSFVEDKWIISLDCTDGLGFLNNLSYVDNVTKEKFSGKQSQLEVIVNCLKRTGFNQNIYVRVQYIKRDETDGLPLLQNTYVDSFRYVKDDNVTTMQCNEVLKTVLELYSLVITQKDGDWYIYRPNDLYILKTLDTDTLTFYAYDSNGTPLNPTTKTVNFAQDLGSQIDNFYPHHVNGNQQLSIDNSIAAYRINYKYGLTNSLFDNIYLENVGGVIDEWTINDATKLTFPTDNRGFILEGTVRNQQDLILTSDSIIVAENDIIVNKGVIEYIFKDILFGNALFKSKVILTDGTNTRYLQKDGSWSSSSTYIDFTLPIDNTFIYEIKTEPIPFDGSIYIELYTPSPISFNNDYTVRCLITESTLKVTDSLGELKGEIHTFQRTDNSSSKIAETKEVFNGDINSALYSGTIYGMDETTPTDIDWYIDSPFVFRKPILRIMGEERMKMYEKPLKVFKGDVYGYIDYLSVISINNITGWFMPIEWNYDASKNITKLKLKEILNLNPFLTSYPNITHSVILDNGDVQDPTITN